MLYDFCKAGGYRRFRSAEPAQRVAIYARQSVYKQDSISIETQINECKSILNNSEIFKVYSDEGYSGKNTDRPAFQQMLKDVQNGKIYKIIVYKLDRFSRSIVDFYDTYEILKKHKCDFISVNDQFNTSTCVAVMPKPLRRYRKVKIIDDSGNESTMLLDKHSKVKIGYRYRFYFKETQRISFGSDYLDSAMSSDCFLGYEELGEFSAETTE